MKSKLLLLSAAVFVSVSLVALSFSGVQALNTHSVDLESGSSQYLSITDDSQTGLDITGDITMEAWVNVESQPSTNQSYTIVGKWGNNQSVNQSYLMRYGDESGTKKIIFIGNDGTDVRLAKADVNLSNGTWSHVAVTWDASSSTAVIYVNGIAQTTTMSGVSITSIFNGSGTFVAGARDAGTFDEFFDGKIDDVRVWSRERTATEVADDRLRELNGNETGLVGYWKLNNSLSDSTSNNNALTNNGSAIFDTATPFDGFTEDLSVRKSSNESISTSTVLQNDDELKLSLAANKTYAVDGVLFASSTSATPDIIIAFFGQTGSDIRIGYTNDVNELVLFSGDESNRIQLPADIPTSVHIKGTVTTLSTSGDLQLKWAQATSNTNATTVMEGSYLRAEEI